MINKITDKVFSEAASEMNCIEKNAIEIGITPGAAVGSIIGGVVSARQTSKQLMNAQRKLDNTTVLNGNYYTQTENILNNLKIIFTPFSVLFVVKNGIKEMTIDTILTEEMNRSMYMAWQNRDTAYFKNLLVNKMMAEIQFAEQQFAKNIISKHMQAQGTMKQASYGCDNLCSPEIFAYTKNIQKIYSKQNDITEKLAETVMGDFINDDTSITIPLKLARPVAEYDDMFGEKLAFFGFGDDLKHENSSHFLSPNYLMNNIHIGFMPDRVVYSVDNKVVNTLLCVNMNADAFDAFNHKDRMYFMKLFKEEMKLGLIRMKAKLTPSTEKNAAESENLVFDIKNIFSDNATHPYVYLKVLCEKYGKKWFNFDATALVKIIETDFELENGISDIPLNTILSIQTCNASALPYSNPHVFEKAIRSFNDMPIVWEMEESEDITPAALAFGIDIFDMVTPDEDTYDDFSEDTLSYITDILVRDKCQYFCPEQAMIKSPIHTAFYEILNEQLLKKNFKENIYGAENADEKVIVELCTKIQNTTKTVLEYIRNAKQIVDDNFIQQAALQMGAEQDIIPAIINNINLNIDLDNLLTGKTQILSAQLKLYGLQ